MPQTRTASLARRTVRPMRPTTVEVGDPVEGLRGRADMLFRAAAECLHQRDRYARLVEHEVLEGEQRGARQIVELCDEMLAAAVASYQKWSHVRPTGEIAWWHAANGLWMAAREFARRCDCSTRAARSMGNTIADLGELACDFDLEASALLGLRVAVEAYRKARPAAALSGVTPRA